MASGVRGDSLAIPLMTSEERKDNSCAQRVKKWGISDWFESVVSPVGIACSAAASAFDISPTITAVTSFAAGFFSQSTTHAFVETKDLPNYWRIPASFFGQGLIYFLNSFQENIQLHEDEDHAHWRAFLIRGVIFALGVNEAIRLKRLMVNRGVVTVDRGAKEQRSHSQNLKLQIVSDRQGLGLRLLSTSAFATLAVMNRDSHSVRNIFTALGAHFLGQAAGEYGANFIDRKIEKEERSKDSSRSMDSLDALDEEVSPWEKVKAVASTTGAVTSPLFLVCLVTYPEFGVNLAVGLVTGTNDGMQNRFLENRVNTIDIKHLTELQRHDPERPIISKALKVFRFSNLAAVIGFTSSQAAGWNLESFRGKVAISVMGGVCLLTFSGAYLLDRAWKQSERAQDFTPNWKVRIKDGLVFRFLVSDYFGMRALMYYFFVASNMELNDEALAKLSGFFPLGFYFSSWAANGFAQGLETYRTAMDRRGFFQIASMAEVNGNFALVRMLRGDPYIPWRFNDH